VQGFGSFAEAGLFGYGAKNFQPKIFHRAQADATCPGTGPGRRSNRLEGSLDDRNSLG
jgi:hypothetical protein